MKRLPLTALILTAILLLNACDGQKTFRIGVSQCSEDDWRAKLNSEILREALFHDNVQVEIRSADDDNTKQIADIRYFADNHFDIIVCAPNEADALTPVVKDVYDSGIPVLLFDRNINGDHYTAWQGADNVEIGKNAAQLAHNMLGSRAKVIEIYGLQGSTPAIERHRGFTQRAEELGVEVLATGYGDWTPDDATPVADSLLRLFPQANILFAHNDRMAIAAAEVAKRLHRDNLKIIGIDGTPATGIKAVIDGKIHATFIYPTDGYRLINTALDILEGRKVEHRHILANPGMVDSNNAQILHQQNITLHQETEKIIQLQRRIDVFWQKYSIQQALLYGVLVIMALLALIIYIMYRNHLIKTRQRKEIEQQRDTLAAQKDELDNLYRKLQEATASKLSFFTNVSHDLRTPLTLIADPVQQLAEAANLTPQQSVLMQLANKNVRRLMRLINQILDIRKADHGQITLNLVTLHLDDAVREWSAAFSHIATKNHIRLNINIQTDTDFVTAVDIDKMGRILFNLMGNAFKFTPQNGTITVSLSRESNTIRLAVANSGPGIPEAQIRHVFDQFFTTSELNPNGSGIGLALCKLFTDMHGGNISVESETGKITTFTVALPVRIEGRRIDHLNDLTDFRNFAEEQAEFTHIPDEEIQPSDDAPTVLIIDDNPDIRSLVRATLADAYVVAQAQDGAQGIRLATKYIPDLIICDIMMPGIDGYETCRRLKSELITSHIPVLLLTAATADEHRTEGYACGADGYMAKPFDHKMLMARCKSLIDNRKAVLQNAATPSQTSSRTDTTQGGAAHSASKPAAGPDSTSLRDLRRNSPLPGTLDSEFYNRFISIVERHIADSEFSVEDIAAEINLSRVQLYRKIKALTNYSPTDLQRITRLKRADTLLKTTEQTISEIAYSVGFSSPSYFTKCYRDYFGESPSDAQARTSKLGTGRG